MIVLRFVCLLIHPYQLLNALSESIMALVSSSLVQSSSSPNSSFECLIYLIDELTLLAVGGFNARLVEKDLPRVLLNLIEDSKRVSAAREVCGFGLTRVTGCAHEPRRAGLRAGAALHRHFEQLVGG